MYTVETENRFSALLLDWEANEKIPNELWKEMSETYKEIAESKLGKKKSKPQKTFITEEVFELCKEKVRLGKREIEKSTNN